MVEVEDHRAVLDVKAGAGISNGFFDGFADDRLFVGTMIETTEQPFTHSITNGEADFQSPAFRVDFPAIFERYPDGLQVSIRVVDTNPGGVVASRRKEFLGVCVLRSKRDFHSKPL